jgi:hypothetical protein
MYTKKETNYTLLHNKYKDYIPYIYIMRIRDIAFFQLLLPSSTCTFIKNNSKKLCIDCKHFIANDRDCRRFGDTNLITGKVTYHSARSVRDDKEKCGEDATLFEINHFKIVTVPYYFLLNYWPVTPAFILCGYYLSEVYKLLHK